MENIGTGNNTVEESEILKTDATIPKMNMRFDGHTWTNQSNQATANQEPTSSDGRGEEIFLPTSQSKVSPNRSSSNEDTDREFEYAGDPNDNCFDDEETVEEEEAADDGEGDAEELNDLAKESEMPLEDLIALYYNKQDIEAEYNSNEDNQKPTYEGEEKSETNGSDDNEDLTRQLRSSSSFLSPNHQQCAADDDDQDYVPPVPDDWKKAPRVGEEYQADWIPETKNQDPDYDIKDDLLVWNPSVLNEEKVKSYLKLVGEPQRDLNTLTLPSGSHLRDNEDALLLLIQCNSDVEEAAKKYRLRPPNLANELTVWTEEECHQFELGLTVYGKDFHSIHHNRVKSKSIGEIVKFYYIWKKSERYDYFNAKTRLGKKKDTMHPGVTDYMERLLDETEHAISSQHGNHGHASNSYPPALSHTAALQQHLTEVRTTRRQNRHHGQNPYDSVSPSADYSEMNGLVEGEYPDEMDLLDGIVPTIPANRIYPPVPFAPIDPALNLAYAADPGHYAAMASTNRHQDLVTVGGFPANQNNNSHVIPSIANPKSAFETVQSAGTAAVTGLARTATPDLLCHELENTSSSSSSSGSGPPHFVSSFVNDSSSLVDSPSERETNTLQLKRFHSSAPGIEPSKKKRVEGVAAPFNIADVPSHPSSTSSSYDDSNERSAVQSSTNAPEPPPTLESNSNERIQDECFDTARSLTSC